MRYRGVLGTLVRPLFDNAKEVKYEFAAIDGTLVDVPGQRPLIIVGVVKGYQEGFRTRIEEIYFKTEECYSCEPSAYMEELEVSVANSRKEEVVFIDGSLEYKKDVKRNVIAVSKDFEGKDEFANYAKPPFLIPLDSDIRSAVFQFVGGTGPFLVEVNYDAPWDEIVRLIYVTSFHPIPEALGYVYPLYIADKAVKFERNKLLPLYEYRAMHSLSYRFMRSNVERRRFLGKPLV
jgi:hypothetical protein